MADKKLIICPICGMQYTPSEIFFPGDLIGKQTDIVRDDKGVIQNYNEEELCLEQEYICDRCNNTFIVSATISYDTKACKEHDFEEEYVTKIKK